MYFILPKSEDAWVGEGEGTPQQTEKLGYISIHGVLSSEFMNTNDFHIFYLGTGDLKLRNKIQLIAGNINNCVSTK